MPASRKKSNSGISVVELMFVLAVIAILGGFASSRVSAAVNASRTNAGFASLLSAITRVRSIAANYGVEVVMCPSSDGENCTDGFHWEPGWIAFQSEQGASERRPADPVLLRQTVLPAKVHLVTSAGRTRLRFQPSGGNVGSNATFTFCDGRGARAASAYALSNGGNLRAASPDPDSVAEACADM